MCWAKECGDAGGEASKNPEIERGCASHKSKVAFPGGFHAWERHFAPWGFKRAEALLPPEALLFLFPRAV